MKKVINIIRCTWSSIKNIFSKGKKSDISHNCKKVLNFVEMPGLTIENENAEEYLKNYNSTTRWQTV